MEDEYCYCIVNTHNGIVTFYFCDVHGNNVTNLSKHISISSVFKQIKEDGWEIANAWRVNDTQVRYTLQKKIENKNTLPENVLD